MQINIPEYRMRQWISHFSRVLEKISCDPSDTRTANAIRLAGKDLRAMEKYLPQKEKQS